MNELSISSLQPKIANPYNIDDQRGVWYGVEEAERDFNNLQKNNPNHDWKFQYPEIDYLRWWRYLGMGFPYSIWWPQYSYEDRKRWWTIDLEDHGTVIVDEVDHDIVMNGKRYSMVHLSNGRRILVDWRGKKDYPFSPCSFTKLSGERGLVDIWSDDIYLSQGAQEPDKYNRHGWNARFYDGTFGMVNETGRKEVEVPLHLGPKIVNRILWITKIYPDQSMRNWTFEALVGDGTGVPILVARVRTNSLKFIQALSDVQT